MHFVLEQTPAESTAYRFAKLDMKHFPEQARTIGERQHRTQNIYYTNSTYFNVKQRDEPDRPRHEGRAFPSPHRRRGADPRLAGRGEAFGGVDRELCGQDVQEHFRTARSLSARSSPRATTAARTVRGLHEKCSSCGSDKRRGDHQDHGLFLQDPGMEQGEAWRAG